MSSRKTTRWSLFRTDTQRSVVSGLSRDRNLRSKIWWFTEFCNSHYVSHFAAFFIVRGAKISIVNSCIKLRITHAFRQEITFSQFFVMFVKLISFKFATKLMITNYIRVSTSAKKNNNSLTRTHVRCVLKLELRLKSHTAVGGWPTHRDFEHAQSVLHKPKANAPASTVIDKNHSFSLTLKLETQQNRTVKTALLTVYCAQVVQDPEISFFLKNMPTL